MRYAFLVAWREFAENAKTKGFWIGIFIFPVLIWASISAESWLEKAKPVRNFVLVDKSGELGGAVKLALDRLHQRAAAKAMASHLRKYGRLTEMTEGQIRFVGLSLMIAGLLLLLLTN